MNKIITIVDYGVGNLASVAKAFSSQGANIQITEEGSVITDSDALVLPGVGAFEAGMRGLRVRGLIPVINEYVKTGKPVLGICLGAQILLSKGFEFGEHDGLNFIRGRVVQFPELPEKEKIPHIGWNSINTPTEGGWNGSVLENVGPKDQVYFVHSFILEPERKDDILALTSYGGYQFCSAVRMGNVTGVQFHPEKSGTVGLQIINKFISNV